MAVPQGAGNTKSEASGDYGSEWEHLEDEIGTLVRRTKDYIVFISAKGNRLDWQTSSSYDETHADSSDFDKSKYNAVHCEVAVLEARPCIGLDLGVTTEFRVLLGEALVCVFENDYATACKMVTSASAYIDARSHEKSRVWYLQACMWTAIPCALLAVVFAINKDCLLTVFGTSLYWIILAAFAGAIGALFSVILRIGRLAVDCASGKPLHDLEGFSRILAGAISGTFVAIAFTSGIFFPAVIHSEKAHFTVILLAMISGIAERSAVSLIARFHSEKLETNLNERDIG